MLKHHAPLSASVQLDLLHFLQTAFAVDLNTDWQRLYLCGTALGWLNPRWQAALQRDLGNLAHQDGRGIHVECGDWLHCGDVLQTVGRDWYDLGLFDGWRNERFDVCNFDGDAPDEALFALERSVFRPLGLTSKAVHINGFCHTDGEWQMWIGKRSPFKAVDPDKLDNLVGGGVAAGESLDDACAREGFEEAGLPDALSSKLHRPRSVFSRRVVSRGLHSELLSVYDLTLPADMPPENQDGEVAAFQLMGITEIADAMLDGRFMHDAMLVTLDGWLAKGWLDDDAPLGQWLLQHRR